MLRYGSYLAVMAIIGIVLVDRCIWRGAASDPMLRRAVHWSLVAVAALAVLQLLVVASDIADAAPWAALGSLDAALSTGAGIALAARVLPIGTAYAVWTGIGAVGAVAFGVVFLGEPRTAARLFCLVLIVAGIVGLKVVSPE